jgi:shikimate kinase
MFKLKYFRKLNKLNYINKNNDLKINNFRYAIFGLPVSHSLSPLLMSYLCLSLNKFFKLNLSFDCIKINDIEIFLKEEYLNDLEIDFFNFTTPFKISKEILLNNNIKNNFCNSEDSFLLFDNFNCFSKLNNKFINTDYLGIYFVLKEFFFNYFKKFNFGLCYYKNLKIDKFIDELFIIGKGNTAFSAIKALKIFSINSICLIYKSFDKIRFNNFNRLLKNKIKFLDVLELKYYINNKIKEKISILKNKKIKNYRKFIIIINTSESNIIEEYKIKEDIIFLLKYYDLILVDLSYKKFPLIEVYEELRKLKFKNIFYINPIDVFYYQGIFSFIFFINSIPEIKNQINKKFLSYLINKKKRFKNFFKKKFYNYFKSSFIFIGFSYSGKSSVLNLFINNYKNLSFDNHNLNEINNQSKDISSKKKLMNFIDIDNYIEKECGMKIYKIFELKGENYFRKLEYLCLKRIYSKNLLISAGGGIFENKNSLKFIKNNFFRFYFYINKFDKIFERYKNNISKDGNQRPLFINLSRETLENLFLKRKNIYLKNADLLINAHKDLNKIYKEIEEEINNLVYFLKKIKLYKHFQEH